jgi:hypothetical protein
MKNVFIGLLVVFALVSKVSSSSAADQSIVTCQANENWYLELATDLRTGNSTLENYKIEERSPRPDIIYYSKVYSIIERVQRIQTSSGSLVFSGNNMSLTFDRPNRLGSFKAQFQKRLNSGQVVNAAFNCQR